MDYKRKPAVTYHEPLYPPRARPAAAASTSRDTRQSEVGSRPPHRPLRDTVQARTRAVTLQVPPRNLELLRSGMTTPMLPEMQKNLLQDLEKPISDFSNLRRRIHTLATDWAAYVGDRKSLPPPTSLEQNSPVGRPPAAFASAEDYAFFTLHAVVVTHLYNRIFRPFHPAESDSQNATLETAYQRRRDTTLQLEAAEWRARQFRAIDSAKAAKRTPLIREVSSSIQRVWLDTLEALPGDLTDLPSTFVSNIDAILESAYDWHRVAKTEVLKLDFEPFAAQPSEPFDPDRMEPFERIRGVAQTGRPIVSVVSLGLVASAAFRDRMVSHVQVKTGVLVEEGINNPRGAPASRSKSAAASSSGPSRVPAMVASAPATTIAAAAPPPRRKTCICF